MVELYICAMELMGNHQPISTSVKVMSVLSEPEVVGLDCDVDLSSAFEYKMFAKKHSIKGTVVSTSVFEGWFTVSLVMKRILRNNGISALTLISCVGYL